jgi:hypothetical protein
MDTSISKNKLKRKKMISNKVHREIKDIRIVNLDIISKRNNSQQYQNHKSRNSRKKK